MKSAFKVSVNSHKVDYLAGGKHIQSFPLSILSDTRLGIDAGYYLQSIYESPPGKESLLSATGGLPLALTQRIETDLRTLEKHRVKPVFVFSGLVPQKRWKHVQSQLIHEQNEACRDRANGWSRYENGQEDAATKLFEIRSGLHQWDLWRVVLRIFRHRNVEFIVAPYLAWAQVSAILSLPVFFGLSDDLVHPLVDIPATPPEVLYPCNLRPDRRSPLPWRGQARNLNRPLGI